MSVLTIAWRKSLGFVFCILNLFKRMMCFLGRTRKKSGSLLPMTTDQVVQMNDIPQTFPTNAEVEMKAWDDWGDNNFIQQPAVDQADTQEEQEIDFFQDMQPSLSKPKKILIRSKETSHTNNFSRLTMAADTVPPPSDELGVWDESNNAWGEEAEEDLTWEAEEAIREKKRLERERRHAEQEKKKRERDAKRGAKREGHFSAVKLS